MHVINSDIEELCNQAESASWNTKLCRQYLSRADSLANQLGVIERARVKHAQAVLQLRLSEYLRANELLDTGLLLANGNAFLNSKIYNTKGIVLKRLMNYEEAKACHLRSFKIRMEYGDSLLAARCLINVSNIYKYQEMLDSALYCARIAKEINTRFKDSIESAKALINIGNSLLELYELPKALSAYFNALKWIPVPDQGTTKADVFTNICYVHLLKASFDSSHFYAQKAISYYSDLQDSVSLGQLLSHLGVIYHDENNYKDALGFYADASRMLKLKDAFGYRMNLLRIAKTNFDISEYNKSLFVVNSLIHSIKDTVVSAYFSLLSDCHELGWSIHQKNKTFDSALYHLKEMIKYDSLIDQENSKKEALTIEAKFHTTKLKRQKIKAQQQTIIEKRKRKMALISLAALCIIAILVVINYQQRLKAKNLLTQKNEELHLQKLDELAKEKQLEKITALMEGQEQERARIAGELHDGLGSLLATVKHHFEVVEDKMDEGAEQYEKAYELLDQASEEVRRISHDMASNVLSKFGLVPALRDLVETVSNDRLKINLKITGLEDRLENSTEIHLFRIIQELVSNILRHARASEASIQLTMREDALSLIVEDNGQGFDANNLTEDDGMGLGHMKARVEHLNGEMNIDSKPGHGSTTVIEIPIRA